MEMASENSLTSQCRFFVLTSCSWFMKPNSISAAMVKNPSVGMLAFHTDQVDDAIICKIIMAGHPDLADQHTHNLPIVLWPRPCKIQNPLCWQERCHFRWGHRPWQQPKHELVILFLKSNSCVSFFSVSLFVISPLFIFHWPCLF